MGHKLKIWPAFLVNMSSIPNPETNHKKKTWGFHRSTPQSGSPSRSFNSSIQAFANLTIFGGFVELNCFAYLFKFNRKEIERISFQTQRTYFQRTLHTRTASQRHDGTRFGPHPGLWQFCIRKILLPMARSQ